MLFAFTQFIDPSLLQIGRTYLEQDPVDIFSDFIDTSSEPSEGSQKLIVTFKYRPEKLLERIGSQFVPFDELIQDSRFTAPNRKYADIEYQFQEYYRKSTPDSDAKTVNFARMSITQLALVLKLDKFNINLTKRIENDVLTVIEAYFDFKVGYQTWTKRYNKEQRAKIITHLHGVFAPIYPLSTQHLDIIIRRGSYYHMQQRLRRDKLLLQRRSN